MKHNRTSCVWTSARQCTALWIDTKEAVNEEGIVQKNQSSAVVANNLFAVQEVRVQLDELERLFRGGTTSFVSC